MGYLVDEEYETLADMNEYVGLQSADCYWRVTRLYLSQRLETTERIDIMA
jgi:hypothetical protein